MAVKLSVDKISRRAARDASRLDLYSRELRPGSGRGRRYDTLRPKSCHPPPCFASSAPGGGTPRLCDSLGGVVLNVAVNSWRRRTAYGEYRRLKPTKTTGQPAGDWCSSLTSCSSMSSSSAVSTSGFSTNTCLPARNASADHLRVQVMAGGNQDCVDSWVGHDLSIICRGCPCSYLARNGHRCWPMPCDNGLNVEAVSQLLKVRKMGVLSERASAQNSQSNCTSMGRTWPSYSDLASSANSALCRIFEQDSVRSRTLLAQYPVGFCSLGHRQSSGRQWPQL